ncbi:MAG: pyruvate dehydrogenase complex dihydrolipoamide acetyltransferase [Bacteroidota bacterium]
MAEVITMPRLSDTMEEGNLVEWHKKVGEEVETGELLAEIETDKATMDFDSPADGFLLHIAVEQGAVPIDSVIAVIGEEGEDWEAAVAEASGGTSSDDNSINVETNEEKVEAPQASTPEPLSTTVADSTGSAASDSRIKASPLAKSMAKEAGIALSSISGSGDNGRIVKRDVEAVLSQQQSAVPAMQESAPAPEPTPAPTTTPVPKEETPTVPSVVPFSFAASGENYVDKPVTQMRKVIAKRLGESKFTAPHFYLTIEVDMENAVKLRKQLNTVSPVKISFNDLVVKAVASALRSHPAVNADWMGDFIRENTNVNIGVAVAVEDGLLVPVIRHADMKTLSQINTEVKEMAGRARIRKLQPQEMQGSTFTISNLGMFGIEEFTAIINPPNACILAVGGIVEKAVVKEGEIVAAKRMKVTLSCDHRVVDGATGAQFLNTFKEILEDPIRILV